MNDRELAWKEIRRESIIKDEWIDFKKSIYRYPDGRIYEPFYSYSRRDYAVIIASDEEGKFLCVRQFRQGIRQVTTEFPAGGIEKEDGIEYGSAELAQKALEAAKRELREETGYVSDDWKHVITIPSDATVSENYAYIYTAKNCRRAGEQNLDETELINVLHFSEEEIDDLIAAGKFQQAVHVMGWLLAKGGEKR